LTVEVALVFTDCPILFLTLAKVVLIHFNDVKRGVTYSQGNGYEDEELNDGVLRKRVE